MNKILYIDLFRIAFIALASWIKIKGNQCLILFFLQHKFIVLQFNSTDSIQFYSHLFEIQYIFMVRK